MSVIGVDEAGRGCWAGPVVAAAVLTLDDATRAELKAAGVRDSKKLLPAKREQLYKLIRGHSKIVSAVGVRSAAAIDELNIRRATLSAMALAANDILATVSDAKGLEVRVDGKDVPDKLDRSVPMRAIVGGDDSDVTIAAASIVAKVLRDRIMEGCDELHPGYDFAQNKAYGVPNHIAALKSLGPSPIHRLSYKPLQDLYSQK